MSARHAAALELSYQLADLAHDDAAFMAGAFEILSRLLPCDSAGWFSFDLMTVTAELVSDPPDHCRAYYRETFVQNAATHPTLVDLRAHPTFHGPRRLSDITDPRRFRNTAMFTDVYVPMGVRENISFLVHPFGAGPRTSGWSFCRRVDFTDDELEVAGWCQPVLAALERLRRRPRPPRHAELTDAARRVGLTARELDIMSLVAEGLTAAAIGRLRRISPATVRKHLEHAYAKLGVSDRLVAVSRAREIGLIEPLGRRTEGETADAD